jgi:aspartate carbamoyltransferase catalytic subunit
VTAVADTVAPHTAARRHLLSAGDLDGGELERILRVSDSFAEVGRRAIPKVPALRGRTVVSLFAEESTRTRLSFETAARRLSADVLTFTAASSSVKKGESLRDTVETVAAMGVDAFVVRHPSAGAPLRVSHWVDASVVNAGDGWHEHPTQALVDCYTMREMLARRDGRPVEEAGVEAFRGLRVAIVGDVAHSRVARSDVLALATLGAQVTLVAPGSLVPTSLASWPVAGVSHDLDAVLPETDVCYLLRLQTERGAGSHLPSLREYTTGFGLTPRRVAALPGDAFVMHPGPMNRGVEIAADVADLPRSLVLRQVTNGVAVRMAVLFLLLSGGAAGDGLDVPAVPAAPEGPGGPVDAAGTVAGDGRARSGARRTDPPAGRGRGRNQTDAPGATRGRR